MGVADAHLSSGNRAIPTISIAQATIPQQPNDDPHNGYRVSSRYFDWLSSMSEIKSFLSIMVTKITIQWKWGGWALLGTEFSSVQMW
jgi:hypothetical protein